MSNPVKSASDINWDKLAKRLGRAFDEAMDEAEQYAYSDQDSCAPLIAASHVAQALVKISERVQSEKEAVEKTGFKIAKPAS